MAIGRFAPDSQMKTVKALGQAENTYGVRENYFVHCVNRPPKDIGDAEDYFGK